MSADGRLSFLITFDRIGRRHDPDPLTLTVDDGPADAVAEQIAEAVYDYARPMIVSTDLEVMLNDPELSEPRPLVSADLNGMTGYLIAGFHIAGRFAAELMHELEEVPA